eukprot:3498651-Amphidinium_carterae.2
MSSLSLSCVWLASVAVIGGITSCFAWNHYVGVTLLFDLHQSANKCVHASRLSLLFSSAWIQCCDLEHRLKLLLTPRVSLVECNCFMLQRALDTVWFVSLGEHNNLLTQLALVTVWFVSLVERNCCMTRHPLDAVWFVSLVEYNNLWTCLVFVTVWFVSFAERNRLKRALNGNGPLDSLTVSFLNVGGLLKPGKWEAIQDFPSEFIALAETHATTQWQQTLAGLATHHTVTWGDPVIPPSHTGVALLTRHASAWSVRAVPVLAPEAAPHVRAGRLLVVEIFRGSANRNLLLYVLYGHAGARWVPKQMAQVSKLLRAVAADMAARGPLPCIVVGDLNAEVEECPALASLLQSRVWHNVADVFPDQPRQPTSFHGGVSTIDFILVNSPALPYVSSFAVVMGLSERGHRKLEVKLNFPLLPQHVHIPKGMGSHKFYDEPPRDTTLSWPGSVAVSLALDSDNIDLALAE